MVNFSDADVGKPDPTDTIDIDDVVDRLDNLVGGLIGTTSLAAVDIDGGSIDGTIIGGTTKAAGSFTTLVATGTAQITGASTFSGAVVASSTLGVTGVSTFSGAVVASSTLGVTGASTFRAAVVASSTLSVASTLGVTGASTFSGAVVASSTLSVTGTATMGGELVLKSGTTASGALDNWPTAGTNILVLTGGPGPETLTGFADGTDGKMLILLHTGTGTLTIVHNGTSTVSNRIYTNTGGNIIGITDYRVFFFMYSSAMNRWLMI